LKWRAGKNSSPSPPSFWGGTVKKRYIYKIAEVIKKCLTINIFTYTLSALFAK